MRVSQPVFQSESESVSPPVSRIVAQLRTTDLDASIRFYTAQLGMSLDFRFQDFYAGIRAGAQRFHLKLVDSRGPSIDYVDREGHFHLYFETGHAAAQARALRTRGVALARDLHETAWGTREFAIHDNQGHTLYFGEILDTSDSASKAENTADLP